MRGWRKSSRLRRIKDLFEPDKPPKPIPWKRPTRQEKERYGYLLVKHGFFPEEIKIGPLENLIIYFTWKDRKLRERDSINPQEAFESFLRATSRAINKGRYIRKFDVRLFAKRSGKPSRKTIYLDQLFSGKETRVSLKLLELDPRLLPHLPAIQAFFQPPKPRPPKPPPSRAPPPSKRPELMTLAGIIKELARGPTLRTRAALRNAGDALKKRRAKNASKKRKE